MKPTAKLLGLLLSASSVIALAEDKPAAPVAQATAPADATPLADSKKAETTPVTAPAPGSPAASSSNPTNRPVPPLANPAPFTPLANGKVDDKPADPDVLELPKMIVKQKPRPRLTPEIMVTKKAFGEELAKQKFSALDQALNKYTLPFFGTSLAERALEDYEREKKEQLNSDVQNIAKALDTTDPTEAKSLRAAAGKP
jgi:hypothetical protein